MAHEWCEHDDIVRHATAGGKNIAVHVKIAGLTDPDVMKDWAQHSGANVSLLAQDDPDVIRLLVVGPPCKWRVDRIWGNHGYALEQDEAIEYQSMQSVVFSLSVDDVPF